MSDLERAIEQAIRDNDDGVIGFRELAEGIAEDIAPLINARLRSARSEELDDVAAEFERSANRVAKVKGETERTRYALEVVEVLRNRAAEIRDAR